MTVKHHLERNTHRNTFIWYCWQSIHSTALHFSIKIIRYTESVIVFWSISSDLPQILDLSSTVMSYFNNHWEWFFICKTLQHQLTTQVEIRPAGSQRWSFALFSILLAFENFSEYLIWDLCCASKMNKMWKPSRFKLGEWRGECQTNTNTKSKVFKCKTIWYGYTLCRKFSFLQKFVLIEVFHIYLN